MFDLREPDSVWICEAAWDVYTSQKLIKPPKEKIEEYKKLDLLTLMRTISSLDRVIGKGLNPKESKPINSFVLQPSIRVDNINQSKFKSRE